MDCALLSISSCALTSISALCAVQLFNRVFELLFLPRRRQLNFSGDVVEPALDRFARLGQHFVRGRQVRRPCGVPLNAYVTIVADTQQTIDEIVNLNLAGADGHEPAAFAEDHIGDLRESNA